MNPKTRTATLPAHGVETWLRGIEATGARITNMHQRTTTGGRITVTVTITRPDDPPEEPHAH